jgi:protein N-terminal methyltransferase
MKQHLQAAAAGSRTLTAIDCGAGVGRVTNELLLDLFHEVDLLEPSKPLLDYSQKKLAGTQTPSGHRAVHFFLAGLQEHDWSQLPGRYDCIWIQW